jgi:hypothetical protein
MIESEDILVIIAIQCSVEWSVGQTLVGSKGELSED